VNPWRLLRYSVALLVPVIAALGASWIVPWVPVSRLDADSEMVRLDDAASEALARLTVSAAIAYGEPPASLRHARSTGRLRSADLRPGPARSDARVR